ncbi:AAA family ATPase [Cellvibrio sp. UBA7661]|uniref:AAA family ATPase n=1 Tax=Cellvibrio sp. UBA7661 TaxID=1946311 RepID=UPI002F350D7E
MYIDAVSLNRALQRMFGTAGHLLKIWFVLKHMGLSSSSEGVRIDTANSTPSLKRLFSFGASDGRFYVPFAHTPRYLTMKHDASRSIIQTNIQRWASSGSVVTCDPTGFLEISLVDTNKLLVKPAREYPFGLGLNESGFALEENARVSIPIRAFSVWYGRQTLIPEGVNSVNFLLEKMLEELNISSVERKLIFIEDEDNFSVQADVLTDQELFECCSKFIDGNETVTTEIFKENFSQYNRKIKSMMSGLNQPQWMRLSPQEEIEALLKQGAKAILLYGPPRTGKTRLIDQLIARDSHDRCTIQIHDGWGYDNLIQGLKPDSEGNWNWESGVLKAALEHGKKFIVLEEINRTAISQALGEVFSLIEEVYRGQENAIMLRNGESFFIGEDVVFFMTMNNIDKSTEEIDDALMGRVAAVEVSPRSEDLAEMLTANNVPAEIGRKVGELFVEILSVYPLGHGYYSNLQGAITSNDVIRHYKTRVRPVLANFIGNLNLNELAKIDNIVDELFGIQ